MQVKVREESTAAALLLLLVMMMKRQQNVQLGSTFGPFTRCQLSTVTGTNDWRKEGEDGVAI